jgi:ABC-type branched-subunit amino acid transport system substrate-binding protein
MKKITRNFRIITIVLLAILLVGCEMGANTRPANPLSPTEDIAEATELAGESTTEVEEVLPTAIPTVVKPILDSIKFYHIGNYSGIGAEYSTPWLTAFEDMVSALNADGGISDVEVKIILGDYAGEIESAVEIFQQWVLEDENIPFIVIYEADVVDAILPLAQAENIAVLTPIVSNTNATSAPDNFYGFGVSYQSQFEHFITYLANNWDAIKPNGAPEQILLTYFGWESADDYQGLTPRSRAYAESLGIVIQREAYFFDSPTESMSNQVVRAQWAASNFIYGNFHSHGSGILVNDVYRLGLQQVFGVAMPYQSMDINTYAYLGYAGYFDKVYAPSPIAWWSDENSPIIDRQIEILEDQNGSMLLDANQARLIMAGITDVIVLAIENILNDDENFEINGENFDSALRKLSSDDLSDPTFRFDFSVNTAELSQLQIRWVKERLVFEIMEDFTPINISE